MKKLLAITLSLLMVFALVPSLMLTASADDNAVINLTKNVEYATLKAAVAATSTNDELKLLADVETTTANNDAGSSKTYSLDLDGHTITVKAQRFGSVGAGNTVTYQNGNIAYDFAGNMEAGFFVRENSTLNLTNINMSMTETCAFNNANASQWGLIGLKKSSTDAQCNVNITGCNLTAKGTVIDFGTLTKYNVTITDSVLTGLKTDNSGALNGIAQNDTGTVTISNSTIAQDGNFINTSQKSLATVVVADGESVYDSSDNLIEGIITDGRKLDPAIYTTYSSLTFKEAGSTPPAPVDPYEDIAGTTNVAAQLRIGSVNGIRFITNVDADKVAAAEAAGYTVTFGTLIAPADLVEGDLTFEVAATNYIDVVSGGYFKYNSGEVAGSIVGIKTDNVARDFIARGYVKLTKDETTTVYYATQPNEGRSLKTVALACVADSSFFEKLNDAQKTQVTAWANA